MIDSQAVKNTCNASCIQGFCHYKATNGIKGIWLSIHWGFLLHSLYQSQRHWRPGTDWDALAQYQLFQSQTREYSQDYNFGRSRYHPETISQALQEIYPQILTKIRFERSQNLQSWKAGAGQIWICCSCNPMGGWTLECLMERCKCLVKTLSGL